MVTVCNIISLVLIGGIIFSEKYRIPLLYAIVLFWIGIAFPILSKEYPSYNFSRLATILAIGFLIITLLYFIFKSVYYVFV